MFDIRLTINTPEQAMAAAAVLANIAKTLAQGSYSPAIESDAPPASNFTEGGQGPPVTLEAEASKRTRRTKAQMEADAAKQDPAALYDKMTNGAKEPTSTAEELAAAEAAFMADLAGPKTVKADTRNRDSLLTEVRALAEEKGVIWMRQVIEKSGGKKLSDLPDDVLRVLVPLA